MLFNSLSYVIFLPAIVAAFFLCPWRWRWVLLLGASYYFYGCWEAKYLTLILFSTGSTFGCSHLIERARTPTRKRVWLVVALTVNLGILFTFKYYGLVASTLNELAESIKLGAPLKMHRWLLPVGISFYTFQALGYVMDVYRGRHPAERHLGYFALYVAYFPQLVAGPIERAERLIPQLKARVRWDGARALSGLRLILLGLFKKMVIADRLAVYVNEVYNHPGRHEGAPVVLATWLFAFQIYCDFSGYSDIAVGSARILGHDLMSNFERPYAARSIQDFWRRWHISLSSWFRDYLYLPLGGNRVTGGRWVRNLMLVFLISGIWHGAQWTFLVWGGLHGTYFLLSRASGRLRARLAAWTHLDRLGPLHHLLQRVILFQMVCVAWVFFRANGFADIVTLFESMGTSNLSWDALSSVALGSYELCIGLVSLAVLELVQWNEAAARSREGTPEEAAGAAPRRTALPWLDWPLTWVMLLSMPLFAWFELTDFIYFQF